MKLKDYLHYYLYGKIWEVGVSTCTLMGIGDSYYTIRTKQGTMLTLSNRADIKLVLRRLEDMTKEERMEHHSLMHKGPDGIHRVIVMMETPASFHYLLSQHFDLFGLIDAGLAIDVKTITP